MSTSVWSGESSLTVMQKKMNKLPLYQLTFKEHENAYEKQQPQTKSRATIKCWLTTVYSIAKRFTWAHTQAHAHILTHKYMHTYWHTLAHTVVTLNLYQGQAETGLVQKKANNLPISSSSSSIQAQKINYTIHNVKSCLCVKPVKIESSWSYLYELTSKQSWQLQLLKL